MIVRAVLLCVCALLTPIWAWGTTKPSLDRRGVQTAAKAVGFLTSRLSDGARVVVVGGAAQLEDVRAAMPFASVVDGTIADARDAAVAFVPGAAEAEGVQGQVLIISGDVACVDAGRCVLAVQVEPRITIYVSRKALVERNVSFASSFRLLMIER